MLDRALLAPIREQLTSARTALDGAISHVDDSTWLGGVRPGAKTVTIANPERYLELVGQSANHLEIASELAKRLGPMDALSGVVGIRYAHRFGSDLAKLAAAQTDGAARSERALAGGGRTLGEPWSIHTDQAGARIQDSDIAAVVRPYQPGGVPTNRLVASASDGAWNITEISEKLSRLDAAVAIQDAVHADRTATARGLATHYAIPDAVLAADPATASRTSLLLASARQEYDAVAQHGRARASYVRVDSDTAAELSMRMHRSADALDHVALLHAAHPDAAAADGVVDTSTALARAIRTNAERLQEDAVSARAHDRPTNWERWRATSEIAPLFERLTDRMNGLPAYHRSLQAAEDARTIATAAHDVGADVDHVAADRVVAMSERREQHLLAERARLGLPSARGEVGA